MTDPVPASFTCPLCKAVSWNPHDVEERYCGACHTYPDDILALDDVLVRKRVPKPEAIEP